MRSRIISVSTRSFKSFFGVVLGELILHHSDNLSRTLQAFHVSAAKGQMIAAMTVKTLQSMRSEEDFKMFWNRTTARANEIDISDRVLLRR